MRYVTWALQLALENHCLLLQKWECILNYLRILETSASMPLVALKLLL